jgi:hypothetical protein
MKDCRNLKKGIGIAEIAAMPVADQLERLTMTGRAVVRAGALRPLA